MPVIGYAMMFPGRCWWLWRQVSSGLEDMAAERRLLSALLLPGMQAMLRSRRVTFDWIDLNRGGVDQAARAANAAGGATASATGPCDWLDRGLRALDRRCGLPLSSALWACSFGGYSRATVPFVLSLLGENSGPQAPAESVPQRLLDFWNAVWSGKDEEISNGSDAASGNNYVAGDGGGMSDASEVDSSGGFGEDSSLAIQVISNIGVRVGASFGGHRLGDGSSLESRGADPPGALELEAARAWLRQPAAACEGLV